MECFIHIKGPFNFKVRLEGFFRAPECVSRVVWREGGGTHKGNFIACVQIHKNSDVRIYSFIKGLKNFFKGISKLLNKPLKGFYMYILRGVSNSPRKWLKRPTMGLLSPKFFSGEKPLSNRPKKQNLHILKIKNTGDGCNFAELSKVALLKFCQFEVVQKYPR